MNIYLKPFSPRLLRFILNLKLTFNGSNFGVWTKADYLKTGLIYVKWNNLNYVNPLRTISDSKYEYVSEETLQSLLEYFEILTTTCDPSLDADAVFKDGVLTINWGDKVGVYVINKQKPNKEIWLSSPLSGPRRFSFVEDLWICNRSKITLHQLLNEEMAKILQVPVHFDRCAFGSK